MHKSLLVAVVFVAVTVCRIVSAKAAEFEQARWIAPPAVMPATAACPLFRKVFRVDAKPQRATLRIVGLGDYDASVNGKHVSPTGINQPWSQYEKTIYFRDYDITNLVYPGANCVAVMLGNSFWHNVTPPAGRYFKHGTQRLADEPYLLCAEILLQQPGGGMRHVGTDTTWRYAPGPVQFSHLFGGEDYDARRRQRGWDQAGFDDHDWQTPRAVPAPAGRLERQFWPGFQTYQRHAPVAVKEPEPGVFVYCFPQNMSAQLRVELAGGKPGDRIQFRCGEHKNDRDRLFGGYVVGCNLVTDGKPLIHNWVFFYLGMQFVEVAGAVPQGHANPRNLPIIRRMELVHVRVGLPETGAFHCSSELFNQTHELIDWANRSNTSWVLTDCPHREKLGWLECAYLLQPSFQYRYDCRQWYAKIARDVHDAQEPSGRARTVAPTYLTGPDSNPFRWTVEWGAAAVMVPWQHYEWYGNKQILRDHFDMMCRFTDHIQTEAKDGLAPGGLGDWYDYGHGKPPGPSRYTPTELSATATWALCAQTVSRAAEVLGRPDDVKKYRDLHTRIAMDFRRHFQDPVTRKLRHLGSSQCANAMALCTDVIRGSDRDILVTDIIADLERRNWQQTPGDVGHVYFIRALAGAGRSDVLHRVYSRNGLGSYGGILSKGLTSLPETWDAMMDGRQSLNHCMLGHVMEWFYGYVGGIRQQPGSVGWRKILIAPQPGRLTSAEISLRTPRGRITCCWRLENGKFVLEVEIPDNVEARAILPSGRTAQLESGRHVLEEPRRR